MGRLGWFGVGALASLALACSRNPATGQRQLMLVDEVREIAMGREADGQVTARLGVLDDPRLQEYVARVGARIAAVSERPALPWRFRIVDDGAVNAFALPGGFVYVTRGLLAHLNSESELAAVLAHEIGHVAARHSARRTSQTRIATISLGLGALLEPRLARNLDLAEAGLQLLMLKFGRDDEGEADLLGVRYVGRAAYETAAVVRVLRMLGRVETGQPLGGYPGWFSTHPASAERVERVAALPCRTGRHSRAEYLRRIDGLLFGDDPRGGFFRAGFFVHPTMDVRIAVPYGWLTKSEPASLVAISPEGDAAIAVSPAEAESARLAAEAFGLTGVVRASDARRDGACWMREFEHRAGDGATYRGLACFEERGTSVVRLLGYARSDVFDRHRPVLRAAISSVGPAGSSQRQPRRVQVLDAGPLQLDEFAQLYCAGESRRTLALINGLDPGDPAAVMPQPAKRIVGGSGE